MSAHDYATSEIHSQGESLQLIVDWAQPAPQWRAIDIATGAGHVALAFAPHVDSVVATDITDEMLMQTLQLAESRSVSNIETVNAEAESLPFEDGSFDLVACRLARHHFYDSQKSLHEMNRVLKPGGTLAFTDNVTVDDPTAAEVYNRYEQIRDPSHEHVGSLKELQRDFASTGFQILHSRVLKKEFEFHRWADRQNVSDADKTVLLDIMKSIPTELTPLFAPRWADQTMYFSLWEAALVAKKTTS